jgi:hypothetical protein
LRSTSTASLLRLIDRDQPTLLLDEADNVDFVHEPVLRSIVNDGFEEGGVRAIVVKGEPREFKLFAPFAFGAIGWLPPSPMVWLPVRIELANVVAVQSPHNADPRKHRRPTGRSDQDHGSFVKCREPVTVC